MEIDQHIAETIVSNIKDVLRHEINLFDTHGVIIASTNRSRIGHHHAAALLAAQTNAPCTSMTTTGMKAPATASTPR